MRLQPGDLPLPVVQAPMAGGPSTPALAIAAIEAGALGFLAGGLRTADALREDIAAVRARTDGPLGVNLFLPGAPADPAGVAAYGDHLAAAGVGPFGEPRHDDDGWAAKLAVVLEARPAVASVTFGCPDAATVAALQDAGIAVWVTVTLAEEAVQAAAAGADALVAQGAEAGGHRGSFDVARPGALGLHDLMAAIRARTDDERPQGSSVIAGGGLMTAADVGAALAAGADAVMLGTALMLTPEAGTSPMHRAAIAGDAPTTLTRAFSGRTARGIANAFARAHSAAAPAAYPEVLHLLGPHLAAARERGDAEAVNLWAGSGHAQAVAEPAGAVIRRLTAPWRAGHPAGG